MAFTDTIKLSFSNNLIMGNMPDKLDLEKVAHKVEQDNNDVLENGLFDSNQANYNTYYPEVTAEDLVPKENDFIKPVFRALSEVIVHKNINPVDFSEGGILKKSMGLLKGATINTDHEMATGNALGAVAGVSWENAYKTKNGIHVPAGINAVMKIDGKSHPRVARAIMMDPPAIHSTSVTVNFNWDKSHDMAEQDFFQKLGSYEKDGKMVRRIATLVRRYHEISLVGHGADPFAQKVNDDKEINNPIWADVSYNSAKQGRRATKYFMFDMKTDLVANEENITIPTESNSNDTSQNSDMNKKFLLALAMVMGLKHKVGDKEETYTEENIDEATVQNAVAALHNDRTSLQARPDITPAEVTRLREVETRYNAIGDVATLQAFRDNALTALRSETESNYAIVSKGTPQKEVSDIIKNGSYDTLIALNTQYKKQVAENFPMECKDCHSHNISRASVTLQHEGGDDAGGANKKKVNNDPDSIKQAVIRNRAKTGFAESMHGGIDKPKAAK